MFYTDNIKGVNNVHGPTLGYANGSYALTMTFSGYCFRLISWTGRKIDPVGVDYILQKLGFHHARTTIPKWLQRGVMDPLDKVLSVLIKKLGTALQDEKEKKGKDKEEH